MSGTASDKPSGCVKRHMVLLSLIIRNIKHYWIYIRLDEPVVLLRSPFPPLRFKRSDEISQYLDSQHT